MGNAHDIQLEELEQEAVGPRCSLRLLQGPVTPAEDAVCRSARVVLLSPDGELESLEAALVAEGHHSQTVQSGRAALDALTGEGADALIIYIEGAKLPGAPTGAASRGQEKLSVPGGSGRSLEGLSLCARVKDTPETSHVGVILVSRSLDGAGRLAGVRSGADAVTTLGADGEELCARLEALARSRESRVALRESHRRVAEAHARLCELEALREDLLHIIVHDLNDPLSNIVADLGLLARAPTTSYGTHQRILGDCREGAEEMQALVRDISMLACLERGAFEPELEPTELEPIATSLVRRMGRRASAAGVELGLACEPGVGRAVADPLLTRRVLANLVDQALRQSPPGGTVDVRIERAWEGRGVRVSVTDSGIGMPPGMEDALFDKYAQLTARRDGLVVDKAPLNLPFCKLSVEAMGGCLLVADVRTGLGTRYLVELPALDP